MQAMRLCKEMRRSRQKGLPVRVNLKSFRKLLTGVSVPVSYWVWRNADAGVQPSDGEHELDECGGLSASRQCAGVRPELAVPLFGWRVVDDGRE